MHILTIGYEKLTPEIIAEMTAEVAHLLDDWYDNHIMDFVTFGLATGNQAIDFTYQFGMSFKNFQYNNLVLEQLNSYLRRSLLNKELNGQ